MKASLWIKDPGAIKRLKALLEELKVTDFVEPGEKADIILAHSKGLFPASDWEQLRKLSKAQTVAILSNRVIVKLKGEVEKHIRREKELTEMMILLKSLNANLETLTMVDALTGIANRRRFEEHLIEEWRRARRQNHSLSLLMIDIDFFKRLNDTYGHQRGDDVLHEVGNALANLLRRPGDLAARYGGEEFAVILPQSDKVGAQDVAERIRKSIEELNIPNEKSSIKKTLTVSIGVATQSAKNLEDPKELVLAADKALYKAKEMGRNQVQYFQC